ncbi:MAG: transketolase, partial [Acidobacteriota bacterium]|nr:transketolase [Acidobacteriota bacterium]
MTAQQPATDTKQVPASHSDLSGQLSYVSLEVFNQLSGLDVNAEQRAAIFSALCRINVLYMVAKAGSGHLGTCFSSLDIMSWVYLEELRNVESGDGNCDIFFSSKGHDAPSQYAVLIARGLLDFELIHQLRRLHGLPGHPHVETPYLHCNTGSLGMGISKAKGMAEANRLNGIDRKVFVMTGDGELQEGQIWESLSSAARRGLSEITAIVDHNKVQSDTWVSDVSPLGDLEAKFAGFGWHVACCDGHDFGALNAALRDFDAVTDKPKVLIADTVKGKGVSFMESSAIGPDGFYHYHSGAPTDDEYDRGLEELLESARGLLADTGVHDLPLQHSDRLVRRQHGKQERLVVAYSTALVEQAESDPNI